MSLTKKLLRSNPAGGKNIESWDAMLELKAQGKAKAVGVSNFGVSHLQGLKDAGRELPYDRSILAWPFVPSLCTRLATGNLTSVTISGR